MDANQIKNHLRDIADQLLEDVDGVSYMQVFDAFKSSVSAEDLMDFGAEQVDELLRRWAKDIVDGKRRNSNGQLSFEGIGEFDDTVTTLNAEGAYVVKRLRHATKADLLADEQIHNDNVRKATEALERARKRNLRLIPLMDDYGYDIAGDALDHLEQLTQGG